jgi:hypothetical protein
MQIVICISHSQLGNQVKCYPLWLFTEAEADVTIILNGPSANHIKGECDQYPLHWVIYGVDKNDLAPPVHHEVHLWGKVKGRQNNELLEQEAQHAAALRASHYL